ncbi:TPA: helix-turn-helix domain-containing protein [Stenotrophomonas maltophilia]|nr:helix-turn-helix domain-containing protein [Stenotrophomonas maltophilia]
MTTPKKKTKKALAELDSTNKKKATSPAPSADAKGKKNIPSHEAIWGKAVIGYGYAAIPSIFLQAQKRLGLNCTQAMICIQLLGYWHFKDRRPFPAKRELAERMNLSEKTIQTNIAALERFGYIQRVMRKTGAGDHTSNVYNLDGLITKVRALEPEYTKARKENRERNDALQRRGGLNAEKASVALKANTISTGAKSIRPTNTQKVAKPDKTTKSTKAAKGKA